MLKIYERMTAEGKIGPFDPDGRPRPYMEYPKRISIRDANGLMIDKIVANQREELACLGESVPGISVESDPVLAERNRLAAEVAALRQELADIAAASARPSPVSPKAPTGGAEKAAH